MNDASSMYNKKKFVIDMRFHMAFICPEIENEIVMWLIAVKADVSGEGFIVGWLK